MPRHISTSSLPGREIRGSAGRFSVCRFTLSGDAPHTPVGIDPWSDGMLAPWFQVVRTPLSGIGRRNARGAPAAEEVFRWQVGNQVSYGRWDGDGLWQVLGRFIDRTLGDFRVRGGKCSRCVYLFGSYDRGEFGRQLWRRGQKAGSTLRFAQGRNDKTGPNGAEAGVRFYSPWIGLAGSTGSAEGSGDRSVRHTSPSESRRWPFCGRRS